MVKLNKIYTCTGDDGTTGLVDGSRVPKTHARIAACGDVDETNAVIGMLRVTLKSTHPTTCDTFETTPPADDASTLTLPQAMGINPDDEVLGIIQNDLFDLGADLATPAAVDLALRMTQTQVARLEQEIDRLTTQQKPLDSFILPGGSEGSVIAHLARTVVRRAERSACVLAEESTVNPWALQYLNRLSDFLFVLARKLNNNGADDVLWKPGENR